MKNGFRADIEGLRAIAIGAVLLAHAGLPFAAGGYVGVDVFFVISGFLITGVLVRGLESSGTIEMARFYAGRVRRLLPAAALVLVAVVVGAQILYSPVRNELVAGDVLAAALYLVNWRFAEQSVDYFAQEVAASPIQHYWSLAIEEQFYLLWPALLLLATFFARRAGRDLRPPLVAVTALVGALSLAYSIRYTGESPDAAYFSTLTRGWELALGAAIALIRIPPLAPRALGALAWGGLAAIVAAVLAFDESTPFPGMAGLLPTLGAAALIVAGSGGAATAPSRMLGLRPFRYVGRLSYSWYLWHWPLLIFAAELLGPLSVAEGIAVVAASWIPTALSHRWVEAPIHRSEVFVARPRRAFGMWSAGTGVAAGAAVLLILAQPLVPVAPRSEVAGAAVLERDRAMQREAERVRPDPTEATADRGPVQEDGCFAGDGDPRPERCEYGDRSSDVTVVLFGDSHAMHFFPALGPIAEKHGWRLVPLNKAGCPPVLAVKEGTPREPSECDRWREASLRRIERERPSLVVVGAARNYEGVMEGDERLQGEARRQRMAETYAPVLERLRGTGAQVAVMKDVPRGPEDVPSCVSESSDRLERCAFPLPEDHRDSFEERAAADVEGAHVIDVTPLICPEGTCRPVIGNALVYRNEGHLTATFAESLAPWIEQRLPRVR